MMCTSIIYCFHNYFCFRMSVAEFSFFLFSFYLGEWGLIYFC